MHRLETVSIGGFRRLRKVKIEMRPLMVMIGANGVGKTSLMDAISLLAASAGGALNQSLSELGGVNDVLTRGHEGEIKLATSMEVPGHSPLEYELDIKPRGQSYSISREYLTQLREGHAKPFKHIQVEHGDVRYFDTDQNKLIQPDWEHDIKESALSQVPKMYRQPEDLRKVLSEVTLYHVLDVGPRAPVKLPQRMRPATLPGADGGDLVSVLYGLREGDPVRYEAIEDSLRAAFPGFTSLGFPPAAAGMMSMTWKERSFREPIYAHQLSEGTLRFLWLAALLQSPGLSTITMIDEPEVSLHPELLNLLAGLLREASGRTQVIVATHSDRLVRFLDPAEVLVLDLDEDGYASATCADELDLGEWLKEYSLDEVWRMGRIGGR
jgi:predicted ATPase